MNDAKLVRKITITLLLVGLVIYTAWDIPAATNAVKNDTISEVMRDVSHSFWILPFMFMGVVGHLFWNKRTERERVFRPDVLVGSCGLVGLRDLVNLVVGLPTFHSANIVIGMVGLVIGAKFWPQGPKWDGTEETLQEGTEADLIDSSEE